MDQFVDIDRLGLPLALFKQAAQPVNDRAGAIILFHNILQRVANLGEIRRVPSQQIERRLCVRQDRGQRLIDFVGDRAGKFAQRRNPHQMGHFLALQLRLRLGVLLFGDICKDPTELVRGSAIIETRTSPDPDPAHLAIRKDNTRVRHGGGLAPRHGPPQRADGNAAIIGVDRRQKRLEGERNIARKAEHRPAVLGGPQFIGGSIELPKSDIGGGCGKGHPRLAFPQRGLGFPSSAPVNQQGCQECGLQSDDEYRRQDEIAMLVPNTGLGERDNTAWRKIALLEAPPLHRLRVDAEFRIRIGARRKRGYGLPERISRAMSAVVCPIDSK